MFPGKLISVAVFAVIAVGIGYFSFFGSADLPTGSYEAEESQIRVNPENETIADAVTAPVAPEPVIVAGVVSSGDSVSSILSSWLSASDIHALAQICKPVFNLRGLRSGQPYRVVTQEDRLLRFEYEIDSDRYLAVSPAALSAEADGGSDMFTAELRDIPYEITVESVQGIITNNLFSAVEQSGENAALASILADIFGWEVDFIRDIRQGDSFAAVVEKRYRDGNFAGYNKVLAASFVNQGTSFQGYRMEDEHGIPQFFNAEGGNLRRAFLKAPLSFKRISSSYSPSRLHPVLKTYRPHYGVDYAAPTGTPVHAIGDGTVVKVGNDHAAGKHIKIRHRNGYESGYLHLSKFASGMKNGKKIQQGQVIGYVGATGYATGPHLDFRMKKNGSYVNPRAITSPRSEPVSKAQMARFRELVNSLQPQLERLDTPEQAAQNKESVPAQALAQNTQEQKNVSK